MTANTKIEWADHTFNPWEGCQKVGPGCDNCYAENRNARFAGGVAINWGPGAPRRRTSASNWQQPVKWNAEAARLGIRYRVFCASLADVFDNEVDPMWRADLFELIAATPNLDWLLLTKRIGNVHRMIDLTMDAIEHRQSCGTTEIVRGPWPWPNVWLGATIVNQEEADRDIPKLLAVPAEKRFLSMEPLLGLVNLAHLNEDRETNEFNCLQPDTWEKEIAQWRGTEEGWEESFEDHYGMNPAGLSGPMHAGVDWVIAGGESGPNARPMHPDWARSLRDQCQAAGLPYLFKQWGEWAPRDQWSFHVRMSKQCAIKLDGSPVSNDDVPQDVDGQRFEKVGKKAAGRLLDGREWNAVPP